MKIIPIFEAELVPGIYTVQYDDNEIEPDEFARIFDLWNSPVELDAFFNDNVKDLQSGYFKSITITEAIEMTIDEANGFEELLLDYENNGASVLSLFKPLNNYEYRIGDHQKLKGRYRRGWLRIYAIRLTDGSLIITGGGIKLTRLMNRPHLEKELMKLNKVKDFLKYHGISYTEDINS